MKKKEVKIEGKTILITGGIGFIGANLIIKLLRIYTNVNIITIDSRTDYYDVKLKDWRLNEIYNEVKLHSNLKFKFILGDISDKTLIDSLFKEYNFDIVINLAAQAGVRYSIINPDSYIKSNIIGFYNILEACRHSYDNGNAGVEHLIYASSSSVYGSNEKIPYSIEDKVDNPVSLYAATKKCDELIAYAYSKLYNIPSTGLRFFTVYGPGGRPDMAYFSFTNKLREGKIIEIFNYGKCKRDFTYIDDIVDGIIKVIQLAPACELDITGLNTPPYAIYNIGNGNPKDLLEFIKILCEELVEAQVLPSDFDFEAHKKLVPMQPGDVPITYADTMALEKDFGFRPSTTLRTGLSEFAKWYKKYYMLN